MNYHIKNIRNRTASDLSFKDLLLFIMAPHMVVHVALSTEAFLALTAYERSLIVVNTFMNSQVLLLSKSLITRWKGTSERLGAVVDVRMSLQSDVALELFTTTLVHANKHCGFTSAFVNRLTIVAWCEILGNSC